MNLKAVVDIDVISICTGEVIETFNDIWLGDCKKIYDDMSSKYGVNKIERLGDRRILWVQE